MKKSSSRLKPRKISSLVVFLFWCGGFAVSGHAQSSWYPVTIISGTATPWFVPTATRVVTLSPMPTHTFTRTDTPTFTHTPTHTFTPTDTPTPPWTSTSIPTDTLTFTPTDTQTPTETSTPTFTATPTFTPTPTPTAFPSDCGRKTLCLKSGDPAEASENPGIVRVDPAEAPEDWGTPCSGAPWVSDRPDADAPPWPCSETPPKRSFTVRRTFTLTPLEAAQGVFRLCVSADDDVEVFVNGAPAVSCLSNPTGLDMGESCYSLHPSGLSVTLPATLFQAGSNTLELIARDRFCYNIAVAYAFCMDLPATCNPQTPVPTPTASPTPIVTPSDCGFRSLCLKSGDLAEASENPGIVRVDPAEAPEDWGTPCAAAPWVSDRPDADAPPWPCSETPPKRSFTVRRTFTLTPLEAAQGVFRLCVSADDDVEVFVNGAPAVSCLSNPTGLDMGESCYSLHPGGLSVTLPATLFQAGSNTLELIARDRFCYNIAVAYAFCMDLPVSCPENPTPQVSLETSGSEAFQAVFFPNPSRGEPVQFQVSGGPYDTVRLSLFTVSGRRIFTLERPGNASGITTLTWDLKDLSGTPAANGTYLALLEAQGPGGSQRQVLKVVVLR